MNRSTQIPPGPGAVRSSLNYIETALNALYLGKRDLMEALLICEEVLLLLQEHAPEDAPIRIFITRKLGVPHIRLTVPGTPVDLDAHMGTISLEELGEDTENVIRSIMLRSYADSIKYRHRLSGNTVTVITGIPERVLATRTLSAIALAVFTGIMMKVFLTPEMMQVLVSSLFQPIEHLFISALMCITAPAVFVSICCSAFRFEGFTELGRGGKTILLCYLATSVLATLVGMLCFRLFLPGQVGLLASQAVSGPRESFSLMAILTTLIPPNIIDPFVSVNSIHLTITALTIGAALTMSGKQAPHLKTLLEELDILCGRVASLVMQTVPAVVFCSCLNALLNSRMDLVRSTAMLLVTLLAGLAAMLVLYCLILLVAARLNPLIFLRKYAPTMKSTFLKGSGVAAIPLTMRACRRRLGIPQSICSFSIPLGSTINMDGNCVCLIITSLFFVRMCGVSMDGNATVILMLLVLILSLGAPIAPGTLILCLVTLLSQLGIDTGVLSLIIGINFILEMLLGMVNSAGDVVVALIVARQEGSLDLETYRQL